jgi:hypothetical protein
MATTAQVLLDGFERIRESVAEVLGGLTAEQLTYQVDDAANPVSWLVWHLTRVQDDHVADAFGTTQVWTSGGWAARFGLPGDTTEHGYGHNEEQVAYYAAATASARLLGEYHELVHAQTVELVSKVSDADLDRVVDTRWTPHVTLGVRLVSVVDDDAKHVGQADYVRGIVMRRG